MLFLLLSTIILCECNRWRYNNLDAYYLSFIHLFFNEPPAPSVGIAPFAVVFGAFPEDWALYLIFASGGAPLGGGTFDGAIGGDATFGSISELNFVSWPRGGGDAKLLSGRYPGGGPLGRGGKGDTVFDWDEISEIFFGRAPIDR